MCNTITLNEQQMNLLGEFIEADKAYQASRKAIDAIKDEMSPELDRLVNVRAQAYDSRRTAACIFASSVAEEVK
jgi:hypothetical protein